MQCIALKEHKHQKGGYSMWMTQPLKRHDVASLKCRPRNHKFTSRCGTKLSAGSL